METSKQDHLINLAAHQTRSQSCPVIRFAILVPHRDCLPALETCRRDLFAAGFNGAFAFPSVAPLAILKRPLDSVELKNAAAGLRKNLGDKKIASVRYSEYSVRPDSSAQICFFGPVLELPLPVFPPDAVLQQWENAILAPAIIEPGNKAKLPFNKPPPNLLFRAAALANLAVQPVVHCQYSFTWDLGPLYWLPRYIGKNHD